MLLKHSPEFSGHANEYISCYYYIVNNNTCPYYT